MTLLIYLLIGLVLGGIGTIANFNDLTIAFEDQGINVYVGIIICTVINVISWPINLGLLIWEFIKDWIIRR